MLRVLIALCYLATRDNPATGNAHQVHYQGYQMHYQMRSASCCTIVQPSRARLHMINAHHLTDDPTQVGIKPGDEGGEEGEGEQG